MWKRRRVVKSGARCRTTKKREKARSPKRRAFIIGVGIDDERKK
jgi:hypothetical protein